MTSYVDDKSAACHVKFLSAKLIPFCKGGSIIMGRVEVGVPHMQSFWDLKVIKTNFNHRSTLFLWLSQKTASFLYEFLHEVGQNKCANRHCLHGDTCITPLYCLLHSSQYNMWPVVKVSHTSADVCILHYAPDVFCIWHSCVTLIWTHVQYKSGVIYNNGT